MTVKRIKITQTGSPTRRDPGQREALIGLGLGKMNRSVERPEEPAIMGQVRRVQHLVKVERV